MTTHIYVDESKAKGYLLAAVSGDAVRLNVCRKELRRLLLPGQRSLHLNNGQDARRRLIVDDDVRLVAVLRCGRVEKR